MFSFGKKINKKENYSLYSCCEGEIISIKEVNDATFKEEMLGKGLAIIPSEGKIVSPFDGKVELIFKTSHGIVLESTSGIQVLIHIGVDTVNLKGKHFISKVVAGDKVKKGDLLITFDINEIKNEGYDVVTPVVISNSEKFSKIEILKSGKIEFLEDLMLIEK